MVGDSGHGWAPEGLHFHDLLHTGNMIAAASGASTRELMHRMGHASMRAALTYQHATSERDREITRGMDRRITKATAKDSKEKKAGRSGRKKAGKRGKEGRLMMARRRLLAREWPARSVAEEPRT